MQNNSKRTRNTCLSLRYTQEEKQLMYDLAKKLDMKLTDLLIMLVKERIDK